MNRVTSRMSRWTHASRYASSYATLIALLLFARPATNRVGDLLYAAPEYYRFETIWPNHEVWRGWDWVARGSDRLHRIQVLNSDSDKRQPFLILEEIIEPDSEGRQRPTRESLRRLFFNRDGRVSTVEFSARMNETSTRSGQQTWQRLDSTSVESRDLEIHTTNWQAGQYVASSKENGAEVVTHWRRASASEFEARISAIDSLREFILELQSSILNVDQAERRLKLCEMIARSCGDQESELRRAQTERDRIWNDIERRLKPNAL